MKSKLHKNGAKCVCASTKIRLVIVTSCRWLVPYFVSWPNYTFLTSLWCPNTFLLNLFRNSSNMASPIFLPMHQLFLLTTCMVDYSDCKIPEVIFDKFKDKWNSLACPPSASVKVTTANRTVCFHSLFPSFLIWISCHNQTLH